MRRGTKDLAMKLVQKLSLALVVSTTLILAVNGVLRVRREVALFESDRVRDHRLIGNAVAAAVAAVWRSDGPQRALDLIDQANLREGKVHLQWTWLDDGGGPPRPHASEGPLRALHPGESMTVVLGENGSGRTRYTYVPVLAGSRKGALELSESLATEEAYIHRTILDTLLTTTALAAVCAGVMTLLGVWFVGRPMRSLMAKARRVGQGDFSGPLRLSQKDEMAELASEMNAMCERLVETNRRVTAETSARIAALEQLRHADRLMTVGKLASGIAHELGTPLNVVDARAEMIESGETTPGEAAEYARIIRTSCAQMTKIIRQLLEFARRREPNKQSHDLRSIAEQTIELLRPLVAKKQLGLVLRGPRESMAVDADAGQIQQALTNLLMNAIQSMSTGDVTIDLRTETVQPPADHGGATAEFHCVRVRDEGPGILKEHLPHLFEPFFTTKGVGEGSGLGLAVAYGIVREHGGWIGVQTQIGKGSEFSIFLPKGGS